MKIIRKEAMYKRIFAMLAVALVLAGGYFSAQAFSEKGDAEDVNNVVKNVKTEKIAIGEIEAVRNFSGAVRGKTETKISSRVAGYVLEMRKNEGDFVKKGEVLAVIDGDDLALQSLVASESAGALEKVVKGAEEYYDQLVEETEVAVFNAKEEYLSAKNDSSSSSSEISTAKKGYEQAKESLSSAKKARDLQLYSAEANLTGAIGQMKVQQNYAGYRNIVAPYSGVITRRLVDVGEMVMPGSFVYELVGENEKEVEIFVPTDVLSGLSVGEKVLLNSKNRSEGLEGTIIAISPSFDKVSRKAMVRISVKGDVFMGEFVIASLSVAKKSSVILLSDKAVLSEYYDKFVFVKANGIAQKRRVEIGEERDGFVEILSGISEGEEVVVEGQFYLKNGDEIE